MSDVFSSAVREKRGCHKYKTLSFEIHKPLKPPKPCEPTMTVTRAEEVNQGITSPCCLPHQFTWSAMLVWRLPCCRWCVHVCHFHPGTICVWNINKHPRCEWPFCVFVLYPDVPGRATRPAPMPHVQFRVSRKKKKKEKKVKVGYLYKSQQAFKSLIVLLLVLGRSSLAFGTASGFKRRLSPLFVSLKHPLYSPPFTARFASCHSAVTQPGHRRRCCADVEFYFEGICCTD